MNCEIGVNSDDNRHEEIAVRSKMMTVYMGVTDMTSKR